MKTVDALFGEYLPAIEQALDEAVPPRRAHMQARLFEAMRYALLGGGKRIRAVLTLAFCRLCGGEERLAMPFACAVEMIHAYSLVHDDLPCMDDDDLRRGRPSAHKAFGEDIALLAGDALLNTAFECMLGAPGEPAVVLAASRVLARAAGGEGMIGGQVIDLQSEGQKAPLYVLRQMDEFKTVALIDAACAMGCVLAGAGEEQLAAAHRYAGCVGLAFQIVDDILDYEGDPALLGKPVGSDRQNEKSTYVALLGLEGARRLARELTDEAVHALEKFGEEAESLRALARALEERKK